MLSLRVVCVVCLSLCVAVTAVELCAEVANTAHREMCVARYAPVVVGVRGRLETYFRDVHDVQGATFVRLAWHSAGTFNAAVKPPGGTNGGCIRMAPERFDGANAGLSKAISYIATLVATFPFVSFADMTQIVAAIVHESRGSNELPFTPGRRDFHESTQKCAPNRLPPKNVANDSDAFPLMLDVVFHKFANYFASEDTTISDGRYSDGFISKVVAAMGGHALGGMYFANSGAEGMFTADPDVFDNTYYQNLLNMVWTKYKNTSGDIVFTSHGLTVLSSDLALLHNEQTRSVVETFARNNSAFLEAYTLAWAELVQNGLPQYSAEDADCPFSPQQSQRCAPSTLQNDNVSYSCRVETALQGVSLHWSYQPSLVAADLALVDEMGQGWLGVGFPDSPNTMSPGRAVISSSVGTVSYRITERSLSGVRPAVLSEFDNFLYEVNNGRRVVHFRLNLTGLNENEIAIIIARDMESLELAQHAPSQNVALTVNLISGDSEAGKRSDVHLHRRRHAFFMIASLASMILAVLAKRYSKPVFRISNSSIYPFGPGFIIHIVCAVLGGTFMAVGIVLAFKEPSSGITTKTGHKVMGYTTIGFFSTTVLLGVFRRVGKCFVRIRGLIHRGCGAATLLCVVAQCATGIKTLRKLCEKDDCSDVSTFFYTISISGVLLTIILEATKQRSKTLQERSNHDVKPCSSTPLYTLAEVSAHTTLADPWLILEGKVYDLGIFPSRHPGGEAAIASRLGGDATEAFFTVAHSTAAMQQMKQFYIGHIEGEDVREYIELAEDIAASLVALDTEEAERLLSSAEGRQDSGLPQSLILAFRDLLKNLAQFTPYLPSAVLQTLGERKGAGYNGEKDNLPDFAAEDPTVQEVQLRIQQRKNSNVSSSVASLRSPRRRKNSNLSSAAASRSPQHSPRQRQGYLNTQSDTASTAGSSIAQPLDLSNEMNGYRKVVALTVRASLGPASVVTTDGGAGVFSELLAHCYREVEALRGCVHRVTESSFIATWGAVGSIPFSAAIFSALRAASTLGNVGYHCGVASATSNVCLLGPTAGRTFHILGGVVQDAEVLARVAQSSGAPVLVSTTTLQSFKSLSSYFIHAPFADVVGCGGRGEPMCTEVVLEVKKASQAAAEWMYELEQITVDSVDGIETVLCSLFAGHVKAGGCDVDTIARALGQSLSVASRGAALGAWMATRITTLVTRPTLEVSLAGTLFAVSDDPVSVLEEGCLLGGRVPDSVMHVNRCEGGKHV